MLFVDFLGQILKGFMKEKILNIIEAEWMEGHDFGWCEYCDNNSSKKTYLPFCEKVLNPEHVCEDCANDTTKFKIVGKYKDSIEYRQANLELKK